MTVRMPNRMAHRAAVLTALLAGWALPAAADCYDILGCTDRDRFDRRFDYLASREDGPNCQFLREMRFGILAGHGACADFAEDAAGPGACRAVDHDRVALSPVERTNVATIRRAEALKGCGP